LGLIGDVALFHLETDLRVDLSQLLPLLKRLIEDKGVQKELAMIKELKGSARGKLVLGEDTKNVRVRLKASDIKLTAQHARISVPVKIVSGKFTYDAKRMGVSQLRGRLGKTPLKIGSFAVVDDGKQVSIKSSDLIWNDARINVSGSMRRGSKDRPWLDMDINADHVDLDALIQMLGNGGEKKRPPKAPVSQSLPIQGNIRFRTGRLKIGGFTWNPLHADINLNGDVADVRLKEAVICGISMPGTLKVSPQFIEFDIETMAKDQELKSTLNCFASDAFKADGKYHLKGKFQGRGKSEDLLKMSTGHAELTVPEGGHIYHDIVLLNLLEFLNTTEVLTGRVNTQDMEKKGFGFHSLRVKVKMQDGKLLYEEGILHGAPMTVTAAGQQDLQNGGFDLTLLVAPLVTLDRIFQHVPLVGGILRAVDTLPLGVKGTPDNMVVIPLAPSAVGYELKEMMKNTFKGPMKLTPAGKPPEQN